MPLLLQDCQTDRGLLKAAAVCGTSDEFIDYVNAAGRRAKRRGDWIGTVLPMYVCVRNDCVVWPRRVESVRRLNHCHHNIPVRNFWYDYLETNHPACHWSNQDQPNTRLILWDKVPTHNDIFGDNRTVRAYPTVPEDAGKTIRIFGLDNNNQPLRTNNGDGTYSDGVVITIAVPFGSTSTFVRKIERVIKQETQSEVYLFAYDSVNDKLEDLAVYEPTETVPSFQKTQLHIFSCGCGSSGQAGNCSTTKGVIALVKLAFIPAKVPNDLVYIQNIDALKLLIQAIRYEEAGDRQKARAYEADAIRELNLELADVMAEDSTPVELGELHGTSIGFQRCF